ncbi:uncharacterized protein ARMOST_19799 [Armillaria ostoyae]|uniref:Uncharacterized protein n=1 Tax=Armillaria ostoyae TaxID=47428 RepID=A0A284S5K3_ARMOS|nr:uncharacterized protein ARMOST_19799 [Armillaria ostoyae]
MANTSKPSFKPLQPSSKLTGSNRNEDKPIIEVLDGILGNNDNSNLESSLSAIKDKKEVPELKATRPKSEYALVKDVLTIGPSIIIANMHQIMAATGAPNGVSLEVLIASKAVCIYERPSCSSDSGSSGYAVQLDNLLEGGCILWPGIVNPLAWMVVGTMQPDGGFVASQDPLMTIDRAKYYDLQKNGDIFVCDLFQESSVQPTAPTIVITDMMVVKMDGQQPDTTMIKPKSNAPDLQSKEFIDLIKDAMGFGTEPDDQEVIDAKAMLVIDALKKQILIERCRESLHQNGWKSRDIKSVDMYKVPSCLEVPDYMLFVGSRFNIIEVVYKKVFHILKMTANIYKSLFGDKVCRNNPNIIGEWFNNPDGSDFQQYAEMALGTFSTTIQNVKVAKKEELEQKQAKAMEEGKLSWKEEKLLKEEKSSSKKEKLSSSKDGKKGKSSKEGKLSKDQKASQRSSDDKGHSRKKGKHWVQSSPESSSALSRSQLPVEVHKKKKKKDDEHMASSSTKMLCDNTKIFHDSSEDGDINYLKMHDIKMYKSNSAYELDGN